MTGQLSYGFPELTTRANCIIRADTLEPVLLRGLNRSGLEYVEPDARGFLACADLSFHEVRHICQTWNCNVLRLPFSQAAALKGRNAHSADDYLSAIDQVISWAAACGAYTILDLQWLDSQAVYGFTTNSNGAKVPNRVPPLPNRETVSLWRELAVRYRNEPAVIFDLLNEPHHRLKDDTNPLYLVNAAGEIVESDTYTVQPREWLAWAKLLVSSVQELRPDGLILVSGVDWGFDLRGIEMDGPNLVYSAHIYPNRKPSTWWKAIGDSHRLPVFVGEWGGTEQDLNWGRRLSREMRRLDLSWTAWSWADHPHILRQPRTPDYEPTAFGELVRNELARGITTVCPQRVPS